jgi:lipopolysaccharide transport system ATP-binding protein
MVLGRFGHSYARPFWALHDVSLEVAKGEAVGIVGRNGSGKSTLLQIISGILQPTEGSIEVHGRVAALLELGAGFNPEFTGRENVYMNGSILGLTRAEMDERIGAIESFAAIGDFIDQPVKSYSSGMMVRLAFAVQVQIDPDILIVDEALAVGDALFQKRCYQRMEQLTAQGTTLLFVSHDQESIRSLTSRALFLRAGRQVAFDVSSKVVLDYRRYLHQEEKKYFDRMTEDVRQEVGHTQAPEGARSGQMAFGDFDAEILSVAIHDAAGEEASTFSPNDQVAVRVRYKIHKPLTHLNIGIRIRNKEGIKIYSGGTFADDFALWEKDPAAKGFWDRDFEAGEELDAELSFRCILGVNLYEVQTFICEERSRTVGNQRMIHWMEEAAFFSVTMNVHECWFGGICNLEVHTRLR